MKKKIKNPIKQVAWMKQSGIREIEAIKTSISFHSIEATLLTS
ncbi:hypothetical protein [Methylomonas sp. TEB]